MLNVSKETDRAPIKFRQSPTTQRRQPRKAFLNRYQSRCYYKGKKQAAREWGGSKNVFQDNHQGKFSERKVAQDKNGTLGKDQVIKGYGRNLDFILPWEAKNSLRQVNGMFYFMIISLMISDVEHFFSYVYWPPIYPLWRNVY